MPKKLPPTLQDPTCTDTVELLIQLSGALKRQQRHFDEAVVTHCLQLVRDYRAGRMHEHSMREPQVPYGDKP